MKKWLVFLLCFLSLGPGALAAEEAFQVTRGQFVEGFWLLWGGVPYEDTRIFSDVSHDREDTTAICWAYDLGLVKGTGGNCFAPDRPITREEAAVLLHRAAALLGWPIHPSHLAECDDYASASPWAGDAIYWAVEAGVLDLAKGGLLAPGELLSPQEFEKIIKLFA